MATDAGVLREFFVGLSYKVDQSSQQQFQKGVVAADKGVAGLQNAASKAGNALTQLGQQFKSVGDEPVRKFADGTRRIADGMMRLTKGTLELGRNALATGGAFAAGILQVSKNFQELYYIAQRTGATVAQLAAMNATSTQTGKAMGDMAAGVEALRQKISEGGGGMKIWLDSLAGVKWDDAKDKGEYYLTLLGKIADEYNKGNEAYWSSIARDLGFTDQQLRSAAARRADGKTQVQHERELYRENKQRQDEAGVDQKKLAERSATFWESMGKAGTEFGLIWTQALDKVLPKFQKIVDWVDSFLRSVKIFNTTHPGAATIEAYGAAAVGVTALAGALALFTGKFILFNPYLIAFTGAAALITANWDSIVAWAETGGKRIIEAFEKGGWKAGWQEIGKQGAEALKWGWEKYVQFSTWIAPKLDAVTEWIKNYNFGAWGTYFAEGLNSAFVPMSDEQANKVILDPMMAALDRLVKAAKQKAKDFVTNFFSESWKEFTEKSEFGPFSWVWKQVTGAREAIRGPDQPQEDLRKRRSYGGLSGAEMGDLGIPGYQGGGIVSINAHEGEMVLPAPISRGLQALFKGGGGQGGDQGGQTYSAMRGLLRLGDWLTGLSGSIPRIMVTNWDDLIREQKEEKGFAGMTPQQLRDLGVPGYEGAGRGGGGGGGGGDGGGGGGAAEPLDLSNLPEAGEKTKEDPRGMIPVIRALAKKYNIDPDIAVRVAKSEGLADYRGDQGTSFGAFQLHTGGGMGDEFKKQTGLDPSDPKNEQAMIAYTMSHLRRTGWTPYHGSYKTAGVGAREGIGELPGVAQSDVVQERQQGATRSQKITDQLRGVLAGAAKAVGVIAEVISGGQPEAGPGRVGSHRHDLGRSADIKLRDPVTGRYLDMTNPEDQKRMEEFLRLSVRGGATGIGAGVGYMGPQAMHIGGGTPGYWGAGETKAGAPDFVRRAWEAGRRIEQASAQLDRMKDTTIGPSAAATKMNGNGNGDTNKNVEMHVTNNYHIASTDPKRVADYVSDTNKRQHGDLVRNLKPALA